VIGVLFDHLFGQSLRSHYHLERSEKRRYRVSNGRSLSGTTEGEGRATAVSVAAQRKEVKANTGNQ